MDRRRALMAASIGESGQKVVNHGEAYVSQFKRDFNIELRFEFPCASTIIVIVNSDMGSGRMGVFQGNTYALGNFMGQFTSLSFSPTEDDTYIYEVTIE